VPIARAIEDAGHEVAFATPAPLVLSVERSGLRAFPAGMSQTASEAFPELRNLRGHDETVLVSGRIRPAQAAVMARDLLGVISDWRPDVLIRETSALGGCIAAERVGIPYAVVDVVATGLGDERRPGPEEAVTLPESLASSYFPVQKWRQRSP
jgi:UDP:flavonoid glycosyltransferase YjiC (YdhE family)